LAGPLFDMAISGYFFHNLKIPGNKGCYTSVEGMANRILGQAIVFALCWCFEITIDCPIHD
jgi:hypothetical protein